MTQITPENLPGLWSERRMIGLSMYDGCKAAFSPQECKWIESFRLYILQEKSAKQVSVELGVPKGSVHRFASRGEKKLQSLAPEGGIVELDAWHALDSKGRSAFDEMRKEFGYDEDLSAQDMKKKRALLERLRRRVESLEEELYGA
jgi:hypothetical protein